MKSSIYALVLATSVHSAYAFNGHLKTRIAQNERNIKIVKNDVVIIKNTSDQNKKDIQSNAKDIKSNQKAVKKNETGIKKNKSDIDSNTNKISSNTNEINKNKEKINHNKSKIDTNLENIVINHDDIQKNTAIIEHHSQRIGHTEQEIFKTSTRLDGLFDDLDSLTRKTERRFQSMDKKIDKNHRQAMAGISSAMAMAAIPSVESKVLSMGLGGGSYGGQSALAFGSHFKLGASARASTFMSYDTSKNMGVAAGISIGW